MFTYNLVSVLSKTTDVHTDINPNSGFSKTQTLKVTRHLQSSIIICKVGGFLCNFIEAFSLAACEPSSPGY